MSQPQGRTSTSPITNATDLVSRPTSRSSILSRVVAVLILCVLVGSAGSAAFQFGGSASTTPLSSTASPASSTADHTQPVTLPSSPATTSSTSGHVSAHPSASTSVHPPTTSSSRSPTSSSPSSTRADRGSTPSAHDQPAPPSPLHGASSPGNAGRTKDHPSASPTPESASGSSSAVAEAGTEEASIGSGRFCNQNPDSMAWVPPTDELAVINQCSNSLWLISSSSNELVTQVPLECPESVTYDSATGYVFVYDSCLGAVLAIAPLTGQIAHSYAVDTPCPYGLTSAGNSGVFVMVDDCDEVLEFFSSYSGTEIGAVGYPGEYAEGVAYDPASGNLVLSDYNGNFYVYNVASETLVTTVNAGGSCLGPDAFDPSNGNTYAMDYCNEDTLWVLTAGFVLSNFGVAQGTCPEDLGFSPITGDLYVSYWCSDAVGIFSPTTLTETAFVGVGNCPDAMAAATSAQGYVYVSNVCSGSVSVIAPASNSLVATISDPDYPLYAAYDPNTAETFVDQCPGCGSGAALDVIDDATNTVAATVSSPDFSCPEGVAFDSADSSVWVADICNLAVVEVSDGPGNPVLADVPLPGAGCPNQVADDAMNQTLFVLDECADGDIGTVYEVNTATLAVSSFVLNTYVLSLAVDPALNELFVALSTGGVAIVGIGTGYVDETPDLGFYCSYGMTVDPNDGLLLASSECPNSVLALSLTTDTVAWQADLSLECAYGITYDPANGLAYVGDECTGQVQAVDPTTGVAFNVIVLPSSSNYDYVVGLSADPVLGNVYVMLDAENGVSIDVLSGATNVVVDTISSTSVLCSPTDTTVNPSNGMLYVVDDCLGEVVVVNGYNHTIMSSIDVGPCPEWAVDDPATQSIYVSDECVGDIWVISTVTNTVSALIPLAEDSCGNGLALDLTAGLLFVVDQCYDALDLVSLSQGAMIAQTPLNGGDACPEFVAFDPTDGLAYVTDGCFGYIYEVNTNGALVATDEQFEEADCLEGIVFDPAMGELVVANPCYGVVYLVNPVYTDMVTVVEDLPCPAIPTYDPANQFIYTSDGTDGCGGNDIGVIDPQSASFVTDFPTGGDPWGGSYDPATGEVFIANEEGQVFVISTVLGVSSPTVVGGSWQEGSTVALPSSCAYTASVVVGEVLYEGSDCENAVFAYSLTSPGTLLGSLIIGGGYIVAMTYDPVNGLIYAAAPYPGVLDVISTTGPSLVGELSTGACFDPYSLAVDGAGNVWASDICNDDLDAFSESAGTWLYDIPLGVQAYTISYDALSNEVVAVESGNLGTVFVVDASNAALVNEYNLPLASSCAYASAVLPLMGGVLAVADECTGQLQGVQISSGALLGSFQFGGGITTVVYDPASSSLVMTNDANGQLDVLPVNGAGAPTPLTLPSSPCPTTVSVEPATDTWWVLDACFAEMTPYSFQPLPNSVPGSDTVDVGESFQVSAQLWGLGALGDLTSIQVAPNNGGVQCASSTFGPSEERVLGTECAANSAGTYTIFLNTTDADGNSVSSWTTVLVEQPLTVPAALESVAQADSGQTVIFTAPVSGGTGSYVYNWGGLPTGCPTGPFTIPTVTCTLGTTTVATSFVVGYWVYDSTGSQSGWSPGTSFTLDPDPTATAPTAAAPSSATATFADVGDSVTFSTTSNWASSTATFTYVWSGLPVGCATANSLSITCTVTMAGYYGVVATAYDSNGGLGVSAPLNFTVYPALGISTPVGSQTGADVGQTVTFATVASGGSGGDTFAWSGLPPSCPASTSSSVACTFAVGDVGSYTVSVAVTDTDTDTATSGTLAYVVSADPSTTTPTASAASGDVGGLVTFSTTASGGSLTYTSYTWSALPGVCTGTSTATPSCDLTVAGTFHVGVSVTDSNGYTVAAPSTLAFVVHALPTVAAPSSSVASIDVGQTGSVVFTATASGGSGTYSAFAWAGLPSGCTGTATATATCADSLFTTPSTFAVSVRVTDSNGGVSAWSSPLLFVVNSDPHVGAPAASASSVDVGGTTTVTFTGLASGGSGGYTYTWTGLPATCTGLTTATVTCLGADFTTAGVLSVSYSVVDSNGISSGSSSALTFTVYTDPAVWASANRTSADLGQWVEFTSTASGGSGAYTYLWAGLPTGCAGVAATVSCLVSTAGTLSVTVTITDSNGVTATSTALSFTVNTALSVSNPVATVNGVTPASAADVGQDVTLNVAASGGSGLYPTFSWSGLGGAACSGLPGPTLVCSFPAAGTYTVSVKVWDSLGGSAASSGTLTLTIVNAPSSASAVVTASTPSLDVGQSLTLTAAVTGGSAPWTYTWWGLPAGCTSASSSSLTCKPSATGLALIGFTATDANGVSVSSSPTSVEVNALPTVTMAESSNTAQVNTAITFLASGVGGTGALTYSWTFGDTNVATGATVSHAYGTSGTYTVTVTVTDATGATNSATTTVTITSAPAATPTVLGTSPEAGYTLLALLALVVVALLILGYMMIRGKKGGAAKPTVAAAAGSTTPSDDIETDDVAPAPSPAATGSDPAKEYSEGPA